MLSSVRGVFHVCLGMVLIALALGVLPVFAQNDVGIGAADMPGGDVAGHEAQAGYAEGAHFETIADLPGLLARAVEVGVLDGVGQEDRVTVVEAIHHDVVHRFVAVIALMGEGELMGA